MCPLCLTTSALYLAGGLSAGAGVAFLAATLLPKRAASTTSPDAQGNDHAATDDRIER
jgi:hypothetical protein